MNRKLLLVLSLITILAIPFITQAAEPQTQSENLTLEKCLELAYQNSQTLKAATKGVEIAKESVHQAQAAFLPTIDYQLINSSLSDSDILIPNPADPPGPVDTWISVPTPNNVFTGGLTLTQPLYTFGRLSAASKLAQAQLSIAIETERKAKQTLTYELTETYYGLWQAEKALQIAKDSYANIGRHYQQVKRFYEVGTASKYDLLRAQVQWENLKPNVLKVENQVALARLALATQTGLPKDRPLTVSFDPSQLQLPESLNPSATALLDGAYKNRPEMRQAAIAIDISRLQTTLAAAGYSPTLVLQGSYSGNGTELNPGSWEKTATLNLILSGNLYNGFSTQSKVKSAKGTQEQAVILELKLRDLIQLDLEQAMQNSKVSLETIRVSQANIELAKEALRLTQARYDAGMATTMDIMDSQLALDADLTTYYAGVCSYLLSNAKLDLVIGK